MFNRLTGDYSVKSDLNRIRRLPVALRPKHNPTSPNRQLRLYSGAFELEQGGKITRAKGTLTFRWLPEPDVQFTGTIDLTTHLEPGNVRILVSAIHLEADALLSNIHIEPGSQRVSGILNGVFIAGLSANVERIDFQLANFHQILGESIRSGTIKHIRLHRGRLTLINDNYTVIIDQVDQYSERVKMVKASGGFIVGHAGRIEKKNGSQITLLEAEDLLSSLHFYLSFCRGRWCGPMFSRGTSGKHIIWQQLGSWKIGFWKDLSSWFPCFETGDVTKAWDGFSHLWDRADWQYPLRIAVHWFLEANSGAGASEGSIVLTQTALELLGWTFLVEDRHLFSAAKFDSLRGADKIRQLLRHLGIPDQIPPQLKNLRAEAVPLKASDGPAVFVAIRNGIVHPKKAKRDAIAKMLPLARWEARQLGLWYLELAILRLSSYDGVYYNRLKTGHVSQVKEKVPWAP